MSKESEFNFHSATVGKDGMQASFDLGSGEGFAQQDVTQYKEQAKKDREEQDYYGIRRDGYRKLATIPDIVAIEILQNYGLDLHHPAFMSNPANLTKLKKILQSEYRDLLVNN